VHILQVPSWYPSTVSPLNGVFFEEQAQALLKGGIQMGVLYFDALSLRHISLSHFKTHHFQTHLSSEGNLPVARLNGWNILPKINAGVRWRARCHIGLFERYQSRFGKPDLIHAQVSYPGGVAARMISQKFKVPYIVTEHSSAFLSGRLPVSMERNLQQVFQGASGIQAVSSGFLEQLQNEGYLPTQSDTQVTPNPVHHRFLEAPLSSPPPKPVAISILRSDHVKGLDLLIEAFRDVFVEMPDARLKLGGVSPNDSLALELLEKHKLTQKVQLLGYLNRSEVLEQLAQSSIYICSSRHETFGIALLEALALGLPAVATKCHGPLDILKEPYLGTLVEKENASALARATVQQLQKNHSDQIRNARRTYVKKNYSPESIVKIWKAVYRRALDRSS